MWNAEKRQPNRSWLQAVIGLMIAGMVMVGCESVDSVVDADSSAVVQQNRVAALKSSLDLTQAETNALTTAFAEQEGRSNEPGYLWRVAGDLHDRLTSEQVQNFIDKASETRAERGNRFGNRNRQGEGIGQGRRDRAGRVGNRTGNRGERGMMSSFTEEQKEAARALREAFQEQRKSLVEQREDGSLSQDEFRTQMRAVMQAQHEAFTNLLTDEQKAEMEARRTERTNTLQNRITADWAVMEEVLGLTADQVEALEALRTGQQQNRGQFRGRNMDRDARRTAMEEARAEHRNALEEILDASQLEIWDLHRVLQNGRRGRGMR